MKTLYHVSYNPHQPVQSFCPRIPLQRAHGEDRTTPRFCVSTSLEKCLLASPYTDELFVKDGYIENREVDLMLHESNGDEFYGVPFILYTFHAKEEDILSPEELKELVPDALETDEHWITSAISPVSTHYYLLEDAFKKEGTWKYFYRKLTESEFTSLVAVDETGFAIY